MNFQASLLFKQGEKNQLIAKPKRHKCETTEWEHVRRALVIQVFIVVSLFARAFICMQTELMAKNRTELIFLISFTYMSRPAQRYYVTWCVASSLVPLAFFEMRESQFSLFLAMCKLYYIRCACTPISIRSFRTQSIFANRTKKGHAYSSFFLFNSLHFILFLCSVLFFLSFTQSIYLYLYLCVYVLCSRNWAVCFGCHLLRTKEFPENGTLYIFISFAPYTHLRYCKRALNWTFVIWMVTMVDRTNNKDGNWFGQVWS